MEELAPTRTNRLAGERQRHVTKQTGTTVVVLDGIAQDLDTDCGRWYTLCIDHNESIAHSTLKLAKWHAADPAGWCEACQQRFYERES